MPHLILDGRLPPAERLRAETALERMGSKSAKDNRKARKRSARSDKRLLDAIRSVPHFPHGARFSKQNSIASTQPIASA